MRAVASLLCVACATGAAQSETLTFESDGDVVIVRSYDQFGDAVVEFVGDPGALYQCLALDPAGKPLATAVGMADVGQILFLGLAAGRIDAVKCRRTF